MQITGLFCVFAGFVFVFLAGIGCGYSLRDKEEHERRHKDWTPGRLSDKNVLSMRNYEALRGVRRKWVA